MIRLALTTALMLLALSGTAAALQPDLPDFAASPEMTTIRIRRMTGLLALIPVALLYFLRRSFPRPYIKAWSAMWLCLACPLLIASIGAGALNLDVAEGRGARLAAGRLIVAIASLTWLGGMALLALSARWYRAQMQWPRWLAPTAIVVCTTFLVGSVTVGLRLVAGGTRAMGIVLFVSAAIAFLRLAQRERLAGALIMGAVLALIPVDFAFGIFTQSGISAPVSVWLWTLVYSLLMLGMLLLVFEDVTYELRQRNTELRHAQAELKARAVTDPLTGCFNRRFFDEVAPHELRRHQRYKQPLTVLFVDCNAFKQINDTLGHDMGDRVLETIGQLLRSSVRQSDHVFRWGGDEFVLLLACDEHHAIVKSREITEAFASHEISRRLPAEAGLTIGVVAVPPEANDLLTCVNMADEKMYALKRKPA